MISKNRSHEHAIGSKKNPYDSALTRQNIFGTRARVKYTPQSHGEALAGGHRLAAQPLLREPLLHKRVEEVKSGRRHSIEFIEQRNVAVSHESHL